MAITAAAVREFGDDVTRVRTGIARVLDELRPGTAGKPDDLGIFTHAELGRDSLPFILQEARLATARPLPLAAYEAMRAGYDDVLEAHRILRGDVTRTTAAQARLRIADHHFQEAGFWARHGEEAGPVVRWGEAHVARPAATAPAAAEAAMTRLDFAPGTRIADAAVRMLGHQLPTIRGTLVTTGPAVRTATVEDARAAVRALSDDRLYAVFREGPSGAGYAPVALHVSDGHVPVLQGNGFSAGLIGDLRNGRGVALDEIDAMLSSDIAAIMRSVGHL